MKYYYESEVRTLVFKTKDQLIDHLVYNVLGDNWRKDDWNGNRILHW